jgi:hypothetical protein
MTSLSHRSLPSGKSNASNPNSASASSSHARCESAATLVSSTVNTLLLAYAGAALPLLLLTEAGQRFGNVITREIVATEVVRALVGSIGLVASVPISTRLAAVVVSNGTTSDTPTCVDVGFDRYWCAMSRPLAGRDQSAQVTRSTSPRWSTRSTVTVRCCRRFDTARAHPASLVAMGRVLRR